jgi:hypothetical protein
MGFDSFIFHFNALSMRFLVGLFLTLGIVQKGWGQEKQRLSEAIIEVSKFWQQDTFSCQGYRWKLAKKLFDAKVDSVTGKQLLKYLGKPNRSGLVFFGNKGKNYMRYVYYVYMDNCPKVNVMGYAIQFYFDVTDDFVIEVSDIDYCG